jgi:hypothetical protein
MRAGRALVLGAAGLAAVGISGCSDTSPMKLYIDNISPIDATDVNQTFVQSDMIGGGGGPCLASQDSIAVEVRLQRPTSVVNGPSLDAFLTGYRVEYFYNDPIDGTLRDAGPLLALSSNSLHMVNISTTGALVELVVVPFAVKAWAAGVACQGIPARTGTGTVSRMVAKVTILGEDTTGKALSAEGSVVIYLTDLPLFPAGTDPCIGQSPATYWGNFCR